MTGLLRKLLLTTHVTVSVAFIGAVASFLALALTGLRSNDAEMARTVYVSMEIVTSLVILPLCFAALMTGVVQSLTTPWGLFRHYWVMVKLLLTVASTAVLIVHMRPIALMADAAMIRNVLGPELSGARLQLVVAATLALLVALGAVILSIFRPRGLSRYGWRKQREGGL